MTDSNFFDEQKEQSLVKATIAAKYFDKWASIMTQTQIKNARAHGISTDRIAYIDLFAGPGRYRDGSSSTPVMILEKAIREDNFRNRLVAIFNDKDEKNIDSLRKTIQSIEGIETLKYAPKVYCSEVGDNVVKYFGLSTKICG